MTIQKQYAYFSAAIRAEKGPQIAGELQTLEGTCAIGGALNAIGIDHKSCGSHLQWLHPMIDLYPYLDSLTKCPNCDIESMEMWTVATHLNDFHDWTRERIADWLYAEEEKLGFITISEEAEALKPEMISEFKTVGATVQSLS